MFKKKTIFNSDLPEGVSIVDEVGGIHVSPYDTWNSELGYTGIGINKDGHSFIMAIAEDIRNEHNDSDLSINTKKSWSPALSRKDIPNLKNYSMGSSALDDFYSKKNTNAILNALKTSSNPNEIDNAAVVARNYSKGCIGEGQWDLPSCGILSLIYIFKNQLLELVPNILGNDSWSYLMSNLSWSSNERNSTSVWLMNFSDGRVDYYNSKIYVYCLVLPVYTIK